MLKTILLTILLPVILVRLSSAQERSVDYYIAAGLKNSPLIKDYDNQVKSQTIDSLLVLATYKPQVDLTSQMLVTPVSPHLGYDEAITNGGNYSALIGVKQPLYNAKIRSAQLQTIDLLKQTLAVNKKITEIDLKKSITAQYITSYTDYSQMVFNIKLVELLTSQLEEVRHLVEAGIYQQIDLMNLTISLKAQKIIYKQISVQYKNDIAALNLLSGIIDTSTVTLIKPAFVLTNHFDIEASPIMLQTRIDSLKNSNSKTLIGLNYRPKLEAIADAGFMAVKPLNIPNNFGTSIGLNFSIPIYDGKQRVKQYSKIDIAESTRTNYWKHYTTQYWQQYLQLEEQLRLTKELLSDIQAQLDQQKKLIDMYKTELEKGLVRLLDFLTVVNQYTSTQNNLLIAEMNRMQITNQLNYLK